MGPRSWVLAVKTYLELNMNYKLFDRVISAYKVNGQQIEKKRTSHAKTYKDLLAAANLSSSTKVLFFDDQGHPIEKHSNVTAVRVVPYKYVMNITYMVNKFLRSRSLGSLIGVPEGFKDFMQHELGYYNKPNRLVAKLPKGEGKQLVHIVNNFTGRTAGPGLLRRD